MATDDRGHETQSVQSPTSVSLDIHVAGAFFELGPVEATVEFERSVPSGDDAFEYLWAATPDQQQFRNSVTRRPAVADLTVLSRDEDTALYRVEWAPTADGMLSCFEESDATVRHAVGDPEGWQFGLRFDDHADLSAFQDACERRALSPSIERVVQGITNPPEDDLTPLQRETLRVALDTGYFDVPRATTMVELADRLGVSDQAVSARLRRAMKQLTKDTLQAEHPGP